MPATEFAMAFTSTPRGARLARLFVAHWLDSWGHPHTSTVNETLTLIAAERCANAVQHGRVPGRDFHVGVTDRPGGPGKTVWASVGLRGSAEPDPRLSQRQGANGAAAARRGSDHPPRR
ncbi:hypothetical protein [Streptomyces albogriseolus]|uniref:hypothetical protein n=1 Tax=Streptomyces albogriseolus TaxID=1887 RepID=UPI0037A3CA2D